jgi:hypothetical protein
MKNVSLVLIGSGVLAYFAGGVVAGMVWCRDCEGLLGNTLGSLFIGVVMGVLSAVRGGFPPRNEAGVGPPLNAWPYIFGCWLVHFLAGLLWLRLERNAAG